MLVALRPGLHDGWLVVSGLAIDEPDRHLCGCVGTHSCETIPVVECVIVLAEIVLHAAALILLLLDDVELLKVGKD